jgi:hypothetical protein
MKIIALIVGLTAAATLLAPARATAITATLQPNRIALGDSALLTVNVRGQQASPVHLGRVDDLDIEPAGESTTMQINNGAVSSTASYQYSVTPRRAGSFTIPAISAGGATAQPIGFRVDPGSGRGGALPGQSYGSTRLPAPNQLQDDAPVDAKGQPAFLRIIVPKQSLYVGQIVPVQVKAYFRAGTSASLDGLPLLGSDAFAIGKLSDQPAQTQEMIDGEPYNVLTWDSALSTVKAGVYPLTLDLPVALRVREKIRRGGRNPFKDFFGDDDAPFGGSILDDSIFDNFFGNVTEKEMTLHSEPAAMHVQALPVQGQPADFSGAVGNFDVAAEMASANATAGDPLTLKIKISGRGNFDRVSTAGLARSVAWKTYKPGMKFEPSDSAGISGTKTFEQTVIPTEAGTQEIPTLSFSYFDPKMERYVTKQTEPIAVQVSAGDPAKIARTAAGASAGAPVPDVEPPAANGVDASPIASLHPLIFRPWFLFSNAMILGAIGLAALVRSIKDRRARDPKRLAREVAARSALESLTQMESAVRESDSSRFFDAARHAVQERLAEHWHLPAPAITTAVIKQRLNGNGEDIRALFQTADEAAYCHRRFTSAELRQWRDLVQQQLQRIPSL